MVSITSKVRSYPSLPYVKMADAVLGKRYELSLNFIGEKRAKGLNQTYRKATYIPNVLSFPLGDDAGEIYITPKVARRESKRFGMTVNGYVAFLFIHGLLHLKGHHHGDTMDKAEKRFIKRFNLK